MIVTGGLTWFRDFICVACFNLVDTRDEVFSDLHCLKTNFDFDSSGFF